jgi:hypothetical protein
VFAQFSDAPRFLSQMFQRPNQYMDPILLFTIRRLKYHPCSWYTSCVGSQDTCILPDSPYVEHHSTWRHAEQQVGRRLEEILWLPNTPPAPNVAVVFPPRRPQGQRPTSSWGQGYCKGSYPYHGDIIMVNFIMFEPVRSSYYV